MQSPSLLARRYLSMWRESRWWPSPENLRADVWLTTRRFLSVFGLTVFRTKGIVEAEKKFDMKEVDLKMVDQVKLLSLRVWTEGKNPCREHTYHKVRTLNSHKNAMRGHMGKSEHSDYICAACTHGMCMTTWEGKDV